MSDVFSKQKRSEIMRSIRGRGNRSTEGRLRYRLVAAGVSGWRLHDGNIAGRPDFTFPRRKVAVFVDGCFWHGCSSCRALPKTNRKFWETKILANKKRDRTASGALKKSGWNAVRFWEHEVRRRPEYCLKKIVYAVRKDGLGSRRKISRNV